jgi:NodT family efflux transporter outer membrane factor (OMF) lipoprotein
MPVRAAATNSGLRLPIVGAASLFMLGACATLPADRAPAAQAAAPAGSQISFAAQKAAWPGADWWTAYNDPQLNSLIAEALQSSPTLAQAQARVRAANALESASRASLLPSLSANASVSAAKQSYNTGFPRSFVPKGYKDYGTATLDFNYEFDFWGKNRAAIAAASSDARAAQAEAAQAQLALSAAIADVYADLARLYAERDITDKALTVRQQTADLVIRRVKAGLDTQGEQRQAEAGVPAARAQLAGLDESISLTRNRLAALLGAGPDRGLTIERPAAPSIAAFGLPENLAADLLGRRPDIVAARWRAEAAAKRIKQSEAAFYPNVNLAAYVGVNVLNLENITRSGSDIGSVGPAISLPIFQGGRLRSNLLFADAERDAAIAAYNGTVVEALRQVADAVTSAKALDGRLTESKAALQAYEDAYDVARRRYDGGLANYQSVLLAEDAVLAQRLAVADLQSRAFSLDVALVRALGGGFVNPS